MAMGRSRNRARVIDRAGLRPPGHQLSGLSCVSMSTRHIGHFLLEDSHWSTQPWWKRCMQGNLLKGGKGKEEERGMGGG